jgi:hypothetical protein
MALNNNTHTHTRWEAHVFVDTYYGNDESIEDYEFDPEYWRRLRCCP